MASGSAHFKKGIVIQTLNATDNYPVLPTQRFYPALRETNSLVAAVADVRWQHPLPAQDAVPGKLAPRVGRVFDVQVKTVSPSRYLRMTAQVPSRLQFGCGTGKN